MGSKRLDGILFTSKVGDHKPIHFHAEIGGGVVIVTLQGGKALLVNRADAVKGATRSEVIRVLKVAKHQRAALERLWKESHR